MFTGIVEERGRVLRRGDTQLELACETVLSDAATGSSIAVNGVCLTVVDFDAEAGRFSADISEETWSRTSLGSLAEGDPVNLERPVRLADRLGGHLVQGHVDTTGELVEGPPLMRVRFPAEYRRFLVDKGSVTIDGVSLTVVEVDDDSFTVALIPHTIDVTNLSTLRPGSRVNLEFDVVAKYVDGLLSPHRDAAEAQKDA